MNFWTLLCLLILLSTSWTIFGAAIPSSINTLSLKKRSSFLADDFRFGEGVHIPDNDVDPNQRQFGAADVRGTTTTDPIHDFDVEDFGVASSLEEAPESDVLHSNHSDHEDHAIHVASWQWDYVRTPFIYTAVVIIAGFCKIGFHHAEFLSPIFPESCMLIILGIIVGTIVHFTESREMLPRFTPKAFFLFLLPPIVLESAYSLHDRAFFSNLGTILLYAVVGTIINCFIIGIALFGLTYVGALGDIHFHLVECLVFSALISAVDPVAVLAIFQEVGVNKNLYFLVFGESLLNDAVTIVLYTMMVGFSKADYITAEQVAVGIAAFICVSLGGLAIGILMGIFTALITKHTEDVRVVEPLAMLGVAYLSYLLAEMVHFSGIISIIGCGIVQAHYASKNISDKSNTTVKYFTKMVSAVCDTIIFLFLGMVLVDDQHVWHTGFVLWSTGLCLIVRFGSVFLLTYCANKLERTHKINTEEQFIMAYGGLRGAVAFSLVVMLDDIEHKNLFTTATLFIVLFTVFIQGATVKPLVDLLKIRRVSAKTSSSLFTEVNKKLLDHVMAGVEEVTGDHGGNYWKQMLFHYNSKYLKKWLQHKKTESNLSRVYTQMMLEDHFAHLYGPAAAIEDHKPLLLHKVSSEEDDDILEVLPPVVEQEEEDEDVQLQSVLPESQEREVKEEATKTHKFRRWQQIAANAKLSLQDEDETVPLKNKRKRNSESCVLQKRPPILKRQATSIALFAKKENPEDDASRLLQKALLDNPYNKLHNKYNPNLVGDEDQDLLAHLKKRRLRTRRLTLLAMHNNESGTPERRSSIQTEELSNPLVPLAASFFLERAQRRKSMMKGIPTKGAETSEESQTASKKLERQSAVTGLRDPNGVVTIGEEDETIEIVLRRPSNGSVDKSEHRKSTESTV
ncbi:Na(+)/H(+) exchanger protein 7-like isoform X2 [Uloborus diversus]|uniref:Na(+)/H(+) exchanger protein 7-like isoform X2 n=1 Tax=Uloborus diversus TaxID=327109 RepID=UPI00240A19F0|nr:Na(+)/H(+) exchanger protein 7-like isoform X2 [Uloborus diversus]